MSSILRSHMKVIKFARKQINLIMSECSLVKFFLCRSTSCIIQLHKHIHNNITRLKCLLHFIDVISEYIHGIHVTYHEMAAPLALHTFIEMFRAIDIIMRIPLKLSEDAGPNKFFFNFWWT